MEWTALGGSTVADDSWMWTATHTLRTKLVRLRHDGVFRGLLVEPNVWNGRRLMDQLWRMMAGRGPLHTPYGLRATAQESLSNS